MDLAPQWSYIEDIAAERLKNNITRHHKSEYGTYIELIGAAGELAARRFFKLPEELHTHLDGGTDMVYKGMWVDIKATIWTSRLQHRFLQWPSTKPIRADVILLTAVNIEEKAAIIVGYALPHEIGQAPVNTERDYPCHEIPIPQLRTPVALRLVTCRNDLYPQARPVYRHSSYSESSRA